MSPYTFVRLFCFLCHFIVFLDHLLWKIFVCVFRKLNIAIRNYKFFDIISVFNSENLPVHIHFISINFSSINFDLYKITLNSINKVFLCNFPWLFRMDIIWSYKFKLREVKSDKFKIFEIEHDKFQTLNFHNIALDNLFRRVFFDLVACWCLLSVLVKVKDILSIHVYVTFSYLLI